MNIRDPQVDVSGNVRVIFRFEAEQPGDVDYGDYH